MKSKRGWLFVRTVDEPGETGDEPITGLVLRPMHAGALSAPVLAQESAVGDERAHGGFGDTEFPLVVRRDYHGDLK